GRGHRPGGRAGPGASVVERDLWRERARSRHVLHCCRDDDRRRSARQHAARAARDTGGSDAHAEGGVISTSQDKKSTFPFETLFIAPTIMICLSCSNLARMGLICRMFCTVRCTFLVATASTNAVL